MSRHAAPRRISLSRLRSARVRAVLALGILASLGSVGTLAAWTGTATVPGETISTGSVDLLLNGSDGPVALTSMNLSGMLPGNSTAASIIIGNAGFSPLEYTAVSSATNPDGKGLAASVVLKVTGASSTSGSAPSKSCTGSALPGSGTAFNTDLLSQPRVLQPGELESLCVMATLSSLAPSSVQGGTTTATLTFQGRSR